MKRFQPGRIGTALLALLLALGPCRLLAHPVVLGGNTIEIPAPAGAEADAQWGPFPGHDRRLGKFRSDRIGIGTRPLMEVSSGRGDASKDLPDDLFDRPESELRHIAEASASLVASSGESRLAHSQGAFRHEPWGYFFTTLVTLAHSRSGPRRQLLACAGAIVVKHRLLTLTVIVPGASDRSRAWAEKATIDWANAIRTANGETVAPAAPAPSKVRGAAPWILLGGFGLLAYFLFLKPVQRA